MRSANDGFRPKDLGYFSPQATAPEPESFDPADAILLTLVDISAFMGRANGRETSWSVALIEGEIR